MDLLKNNYESKEDYESQLKQKEILIDLFLKGLIK